MKLIYNAVTDAYYAFTVYLNENILPHQFVAYTNVAKRICAFAFLSALSSLLFPLDIVKMKKVKLLHC